MKRQSLTNTRQIVTIKEAKKSTKKRVTVAHGIQYDTVTKKFIVSFYEGLKDGKPVREHKTFPTFVEAKEALARFQVDKLEGLAENKGVKLTISECVDEYIRNLTALNKIERTTERGYRTIYNRISKTPFANKKIIEIKRNDINDYTLYLKEHTELKNKTINKDLNLIYSAFEYAIYQGYIKNNPSRRCEKLKTEHFEEKPLSVDEISLLFESLKESSDSMLKTAICLGLCQGMRRGEIIGLRWENISFDDNYIRIRETRTQIGGEIIDKPPKTEKSIRDLYMTSKTIEALKEYKDYQEKRGILCEHVMITNTGNRLNPTHLSKLYKLHLEKYGLRHIRFHSLRHTYATIALEKNVSINAVSGALGHSSIATTLNVYAHTSQDSSRIVEEAIKEIF